MCQILPIALAKWKPIHFKILSISLHIWMYNCLSLSFTITVIGSETPLLTLPLVRRLVGRYVCHNYLKRLESYTSMIQSALLLFAYLSIHESCL